MLMKEVLVYLTAIICFSNGLKILGIFPHPGKSHFDSYEPLMKALANKGHQVTLLSYFPLKPAIPNLTTIDLSKNLPTTTTEIIAVEDFNGARYLKYFTPIMLANYGSMTCDFVLPKEELQRFLNSKPVFDLVLVELFNNNCLLGLAYKIGAPIVGLSSCVIMPWHGPSIGIPTNPAYIPNSFMPYHDTMGFLERVENTVLYVFHNVVYKLGMEAPSDEAIEKYLGENIPPITEIQNNISLLLVNVHHTISTSRPLVPGYIEVGGMHIRTPSRVSQHIEKWINESTHGVIYFSMGSMIKGHTFPEEKRQMFLRAFARLPQRVIWKWETETMPGKPDNVLLLKWAPQFDILCHPNVKAFIAHGGLLGVTESVHCGVPMLLMPQFGDQFTNSKAIEANEGGIMLDFRYITEEQIFETLSSLLSDSFNKKAKELSARFKDRPMPPLETAIYWVEYVARHRGAPHLRTAAVGMPLYQYLLLDVIAFLIAIVVTVSYIWYRIVKLIYRKIFSFKPKIKTN